MSAALVKSSPAAPGGALTLYAPQLLRRPGRDVAKTGHLTQRFQAKARPGLDPGWAPVRVKKTRQNKNLEYWRGSAPILWPGFTGHYALACFDPGEITGNQSPPMSVTVAHSDEAAHSLRGLVPLWVGVAIYALFIVAGNRLLIDPDTMWQITVGQWIIDHRAVPTTDVYSFTMRGEPWISTQWLAQVFYAKAYALAGWSGPVVLAASGIAATFALLTKFLVRRFNESTALVFVAAALALTVPHLLARPHVLALPLMVAWVGGLIAAADRRDAPSFWLLPLMLSWANLHGGFVLGLALLAAFALEAVWSAEPSARQSVLLRWTLFGVAAFAASCVTPYGWNALLASQKILNLGAALPLIREWAAADFSSLGAFEIGILLTFGLALNRGVKLPSLRIVMLLVLLHMALSHGRNVEILVLLAPLILAKPLSKQIGGAEPEGELRASAFPAAVLAGLTACMLAGTLAYASVHRFAPYSGNSPVAAVAELKKRNFSRVFNDYDFGGYLIATGVAPFIDGRTELYGEKFFVDHNNACGLVEPENLFRLLRDYDIEATLMRTQSAATKLLDHMDGWQKLYSDDIATIHVRKAGAVHAANPTISPTAN
jgi:hypothetical protein